jgi:hypothetical protein
VAIAGDLNSTPQSAIYDFIASADVSSIEGSGLFLLHFAWS